MNHDGIPLGRRARAVRALCAALLLLLGASALAEETAEWLVLGPFDNPKEGSVCVGFARDFLMDSGGEAAARPQEGNKDGNRVWLPVKGQASGLDFYEIFPGELNTVAYAYREFNRPAAARAVLRVGSDDGSKIWLNGKLVYARHLHRALTPGEDAVFIDLVAGINRLLVKVDQGNGGWAFSLAFSDYAAEETLLAKTRLRSVEISLADESVPIGGTLMGWVTSKPSFALSGEFKVRALGESGKLLGEIKTEASRPFSFTLPAGYSGVVSLSVVPSGPYARLRAERAYAIAGDSLPVFARAARSARNVLTRLPPGRRRSTLSFLASQLEGKTSPSLATFARQMSATSRIAELLADGVNETTEFTGLRQWAYRSVLDGSDQPYSLYLPDTFDPGKTYPLIITLHGYTGNDFDQASSIASLTPDNYIIAAPFGRGDIGYRLQGERDVLDVLDQIQSRYRIDADRVYLMGSSMGGMGAWRIGQLYPDRFAAIAPFCGWTGTDYLENLGGLGVLIVHGDDDSSVSDYPDRQAAIYLRSLGYDLRFDSLPGVGHNAWTAWSDTFGGESIFSYFSAKKRDPWPKKVNLVAPRELYGKKAWVNIESFSAPRSPAHISAEILDGRHIEAIADGVNACSFDLRHPALEKKGRILIRLNGYDIPADADTEALFTREAGSERFSLVRDGEKAIPRNEGGGLADLFMKPLYVVVGTTDERTTQSLASFARRLCDWRASETMGAGIKVGEFRVIEDKALTTEMAASASLLLLGSARENSLTARLATALPAEFGAGKVKVGGKTFKKAGLIMIRPNPESPGQLVAAISLPKRGRPMDGFAGWLAQTLRMYHGTDSDITGIMTADVMVFDERGAILWQAAYDSAWDKLIPVK